VTSPTDGQTFAKDQGSVQVSGKTDNNVKITVNGFWAIVDDSNNFSYALPLQGGENQIKVVAEDKAGNTTQKDIKVTYNP
jgi:bacillopeptidase F